MNAMRSRVSCAAGLAKASLCFLMLVAALGGYALARTPIHSCDFSSESYTYVRHGDLALSSFTLDHDHKARIPFIKRVL
ncbi:MAG: hypothetical protein EB084_23410, partial [Proteobacteria bacterium]|nr:hypothetical protein [Pseudomonadota bacterium]